MVNLSCVYQFIRNVDYEIYSFIFLRFNFFLSPEFHNRIYSSPSITFFVFISFLIQLCKTAYSVSVRSTKKHVTNVSVVGKKINFVNAMRTFKGALDIETLQVFFPLLFLIF